VLACAHKQGIVHRDIKPHNVFCTRSEGVKVLDFGIAMLREQGQHERASTLSGLLLGTPSYMAPEQARGRWQEVDQRTDIWAVGATLFALLTGRHVHLAETTSELLIAVATQAPPSLGEWRPDLPNAVVECVDGALRVDRNERWDDAGAMQRSCRAAIERLERERLPGLEPSKLDAASTVTEPIAIFGAADAGSFRRPLRLRRWLMAAVAGVGLGVFTIRSPDAAPSASGARPFPPPASSAPAVSVRTVPAPAPPQSSAAAVLANDPTPGVSRARVLKSSKKPSLDEREAPAPRVTEDVLDRWN